MVSTSPPVAARIGVLLSAAAVLIACSVSGTSLPSAPTASGASSPRPAGAQEPQDAVLNRICQQQSSDVSVSKCGDFYSTYPVGFVVDAATEIYDRDGAHIDSCGGNRSYTSDEAREEAERKCAGYLVGCTQVVESCRK